MHIDFDTELLMEREMPSSNACGLAEHAQRCTYRHGVHISRPKKLLKRSSNRQTRTAILRQRKGGCGAHHTEHLALVHHLVRVKRCHEWASFKGWLKVLLIERFFEQQVTLNMIREGVEPGDQAILSKAKDPPKLPAPLHAMFCTDSLAKHLVT
jgi:hypothetical protein